MVRTQVYLHKSQIQEIQLIARKERKAQAKIIRDLIQKGIEANKNQESIGEAFKKLADIKVQGPRDLSTNLDNYLYNDQ